MGWSADWTAWKLHAAAEPRFCQDLVRADWSCARLSSRYSLTPAPSSAFECANSRPLETISAMLETVADMIYLKFSFFPGFARPFQYR